MKKKLYLVRHGETESNVAKILQGSDSKLTEKGRKQAGFIAERFRDLSFDNFYTSDYDRAYDTAKEIAKTTGKEPEVNKLLREIRRPSEFIGQSETLPEYRKYHQIATENIEDPNWHYSDEENFHDVLKRVEEFLETVEKNSGDTLAVSHGRYIRMVTLHIISGKKLTPAFWQQCMNNLVPTNTGITVCEYSEEEKRWQLRTFNDFAHFAE